MTKKATVLFSGGVDSTTCLGLAIERYGKENVIPLSIHYGQKHDREIRAAQAILAHYGMQGVEIDLTPVFAYSSSSLLAHSDAEIPSFSYAEQLAGTAGAPVSTYVPFRNGLFLSCAASIALSLDCCCVYYGAHRDDAAGAAYPDCSEDFFQSMDRAVFAGSGRALHIEAPFITKNKAEVVAEGLRLGVPYALTWSCYQGGNRPCGVCGTCIDRRRAFEANGISDPASE
nr:7-cyano-7-deazaguanine synthase QueC [uncultured Agathobaculum sp.]